MTLGCPRCGGVTSLEVTDNNTEDVILRVIPEPDQVADAHIDHLPDDVEAYYQDAVRVLEAGVPDAAAVQLRRTLEAAAAHFEDVNGKPIDDGSLVERIERLIEAGLLTTQFGEVLHHVRQLGNIGAHASDERLDDERVSRAFTFTTQTLRNLFEIPGQLDAIAQADAAEGSANGADD